MENSKIVKREEIANLVKKLKGKIVTTNGAFDLFHAGHLYTLRFAKSKGDILIVCVNSDSSIRRYKSEKRPIIPEKERAEIVAAIDYVDYVTIFDEETPEALLSMIKPSVHVKGSEYKGKMPEKKIVEENGGKVVFVDRTEVSTTKIIDRILALYSER